MQIYYDRAGNPVDNLTEWLRLRADADNNPNPAVTVTRLPGGVVVSTVWLGINMAVDGPPLIFQTAIFGGPHDRATWRYPTEAAALGWHDQVVSALRAGRTP